MNRAERRKRERLARKAGTGSQPDVLRAAVALHRGGRLTEAEQAYRQILAANPEHAEATHLLGVLASQTARNDEALSLLGRSLTLRPDQAHYVFNHAKALAVAGRHDEAAAGYAASLALAPDNAEAHNNRGNALHATGDRDGAIAAYQQAITLKPGYHDARRNLLERLLEAGRLDEAAHQATAAEPAAYAHAYLGRIARRRGSEEDARAHFRRCLALDPGDSFGAALELAASGAAAAPPRPPAAYLRRVYAEKAATWDATTADASYRGHDLMRPLLAAAITGRPGLDILDLGCGTGALAALLRPHAKTLVGVDLAPEMLAFAERRRLYDRLHAADAIDYMASSDQAFDVVAAAAILIHFAALARILQAAHTCLRPGGTLACTLFKSSGTDVATMSMGGFIAHAHPAAHLCAACADAGLTVQQLDEGEHERQDGAPIVGFAALLTRPA